MKKFLFIVVFIFFLFNFNGSSHAASLIEDLKSFEQSLGAWVAQTNELNKRLSELEGEREAREKQIADYNQSMANIEGLITDLNAKVDKVEKVSSLEGVKDILKSYEGTLNVFKKRFSEMAKRLEDQQVKTAVLEKIYQTAQKPLETVMQAVDEQKEVVNKLTQRLAEQQKTLLAIKEGLKNQTTPTETLVKGIEELNARLSNLESGVVVRKAEETVERKPEAEIKEKVVVSKTPKEKAKAPKEVAKAPAEEILTTKGLDIGRGLFIKNIEFKPFGSSTYVNGEITNKSDRDHGIAEFKFQVYNKEAVLLESHRFSIGSFRRDSTKVFEEVIVGVKPKNIAKYAVFLAEMPLISATGEEEIKIIERKPKVAMKETDMKQAEVEKDKLTAKEAWETAKELKGFENLGSDFYVRNVSFDSFGSSSTVKGEIKNNSKKDYYLASFIMKIYSNDYGMLTSFDFSVRRLKSGDIKTFEEIITGIRPVDIARYEIVPKKFY
jgi:hypothetical protein